MSGETHRRLESHEFWLGLAWVLILMLFVGVVFMDREANARFDAIEQRLGVEDGKAE